MRDLSNFYRDLRVSHGARIAEETERLHTLFDEGIYKWLASLWDGRAGGFYYSISARDNMGFYPDMESTAQALNSLESFGILKNEEVPLRMQKKMVAFMQAKQHEDDGYFYHAQWGKDVSTSRRARDLSHALSIFSRFGGAPLYKTALERIGEAAADGKTETEGSTVPEHLRSAAAFREYLEGLGINEQSYSVGHRIGAQAAQIAAAGLTDVCIDFLNSTQKSNGFWEDVLNHSSSNGMMKISCAYVSLGAPIPNVMTSFDSALEVLLSDLPYSAITEVFNPPFSLLNFLEILERTGDRENLVKAKELLLSRGADIIRVAYERLIPFKKPDGSFSYCKSCSSHWSQGKPVCIKDSFESDVNANSLANGSRVRSLKIFGIEPPKIFDADDARLFYELCGE